MPDAGLTADGQAVWAFAPGHVATARKLARLAALAEGRVVSQAPPERRLMRIKPSRGEVDNREVFIFQLDPQ